MRLNIDICVRESRYKKIVVQRIFKEGRCLFLDRGIDVAVRKLNQ